MAKKKPQLQRNSVGGIDLLVERDSGNPILILTGSTKYSQTFWRQMKALAHVALSEMSTNPQAKVRASDRFMNVAKLLLEIMVETDERLDETFKMSELSIAKTANSIEKAFNKGELKEDENMELYYSGMVDEYGGFYEKEIEKYIATKVV